MSEFTQKIRVSVSYLTLLKTMALHSILRGIGEAGRAKWQFKVDVASQGYFQEHANPPPHPFFIALASAF